MRIRSQKPEFWADQELAETCSRDARLLYKGLWNMADEWARTRGDARHVKGQLFPYDDDLGPAEIDALIDELVKAGKVVRYFAGGGTYLHLPNLHRHQRLEPERVPSKLPEPPDPDEPALFDVVQIRANESAPLSANGSALSREQGTGNRGGCAQESARAAPPPRTCEKHPKGTTRACRACGAARVEAEAWEAQRRERQAREPPCPRHDGEIASNCRICASERKGRT